MRKRTWLILILIACIPFWAVHLLFIFAGPSLIDHVIKSAEKVVFVENNNLESAPGVIILDVNNPHFQIQRMEPNRIDVKWNGTDIIMKESKCRTRKLNYQDVHVMAEFNNRQYPVVIDSGFGRYLMINDVVISDNELGIVPIETNGIGFSGFCHVDKIEIGDMIINKPPCFYDLGHYEKQFLGRTKLQESKILFGLDFMRGFRYILIDNIASEVEFSQESFRTEPNEPWKQYKMSIENDKQNNRRLMIEIPISGDETKIMLDTGAGSCLLIAEDRWEKFSARIDVVEETDGRSKMFHGWEDIKIITAKELSIDDISLSDAPIHIFNNDSIYGPDFFLLGMECFKDTVIVLDFENNLFWVKQTTDLAENNEIML